MTATILRFPSVDWSTGALIERSGLCDDEFSARVNAAYGWDRVNGYVLELWRAQGGPASRRLRELVFEVGQEAAHDRLVSGPDGAPETARTAPPLRTRRRSR